MKNFYFKTAIISLLSFSCLFGQELSTLHLTIIPKDAKFKINGVEYQGSQQESVLNADFELDPGTYLLEFWHPYLEMESIELTLNAGEVYHHTQAMKARKPSYIEFKKELNDYNRDKILRLGAPILLTGVNALGWYLVFDTPTSNSPDELNIELENARNRYLLSFTDEDAQFWENRYDELNAEYDDLRQKETTRRLIFGAAMLGVGYGSFKLLQGLYRRNGPPPIFTPGEPFTLELGSSPFGPVFTLTHNFGGR
ncbi:MAG: hypothetical protein AAF741_03275 [Bacteroidota bacterium]